MGGHQGMDDERLPFKMRVTVGNGHPPETDEMEMSTFDRVMIPVQIEIPMTPELRAKIARARRSGHQVRGDRCSRSPSAVVGAHQFSTGLAKPPVNSTGRTTRHRLATPLRLLHALHAETDWAPGSKTTAQEDRDLSRHHRGVHLNGYSPKPGDADLLAEMMLTEEARRTEAYPGLGWAAINRIGNRSYGGYKDLHGVVFAHNQFQGMRSNDNLLRQVREGTLTRGNAAAYREARRIAAGILDGSIPDPIEGAASFYSGPHPKSLGPQIQSGDLVPTRDLGNFHFLRFSG